MSQTKSLLVIGYGDREKSDEGAGCRIAEIIQAKHLKEMEGLSVQSLTPSLASLVIKAKTVIFINSYFLFENMKPEIIIKHFLPDSETNDIEINYPESPCSLLSFTDATYHQKPNVFWILVPAIKHEQGEDFSTATKRAIEKTIAYLMGHQSMGLLTPTG